MLMGGWWVYAEASSAVLRITDAAPVVFANVVFLIDLVEAVIFIDGAFITHAGGSNLAVKINRLQPYLGLKFGRAAIRLQLDDRRLLAWFALLLAHHRSPIA